MTLILILFLFPHSTFAASSASMSGPSIVKPGDTITVRLSVSGNNFEGFEGNISWDSSKLQLSGDPTAGASSPWIISFNSGASNIYFTGYGSTANSVTVANITFVVKASAGTGISVTASGVNLTIGGADSPAGSASYSTTVTAPSTPSTPSPSTPSTPSNPSGSSVNTLKSLSVAEGTITPAFDANTTAYALTVPFTVAALNITATTTDSKARVTVTNNTLIQGKVTPVSVIVTAENGSTKTYVINATREQDPNYVASANNYLASLVPSYNALSPVFNKDVMYYAINVPYECTQILFTAAPEDVKTNCIILGNPSLTANTDNLFHVVCTAEDNSIRVYTITVRRMMNYNLFITDEFTNSIITQINDQNKPVIIDMTKSPVQIISSKILTALKEHSARILIIDTPNGRITFQGTDLNGDITDGFYDFTINNSSQYKEKLLSSAANSENAIFSTHHQGELPGYAEFAIYTNITNGSNVNVYRYDTENDKYIAIAKNIKVNGGTVTFLCNTGGDFLITTKTIVGASSSSAVSKQGSGNSSYLLIIGIGALCLLLGFGLGFIGKKRQNPDGSSKNRLQNNTKNEDKKQEKARKKLLRKEKKIKKKDEITENFSEIPFENKPVEGIEAIIDNLTNKSENIE